MTNQPVPIVDMNAPLAIDKDTSAAEAPELEKKNKKLYYFGFTVLITFLVATGGFAFLYMNVTSTKVAVVATPEAIGLATPAPVVADKSAITIEVLNGSGIAGTAKKAADKLTALGYNVVSTGNSSVQTGSGLYLSQIAVSQETSILTDLTGMGYQASFSGELTGSTASARIIIGK